ncbi:hypothetical protein LMG29660_04878 [Burkholderia puraquae]|uniref:LysR substrate-binding domain-containing protein n=1 Tax=Burkholderia puraquae TaxID=1904757 RepID=A0A6J5EBP7_9BURK|nr:hypothetical protein LMG29660_04878 [Burkholderia puraquae]
MAEGFDLAIRLGELPDSGLIARKLEDAALCLVASPGYVAAAGMPENVADLEQHLCLPFMLPSSGRIAPWVFRDGGQDIDWLPPSNVAVSDDVLGVVSMAQNGAGICQTYDFVVQEQVRAGHLVEVLPHLRGRTRPFSVIYAPHRRQSAASRALIDMLIASAAAGPVCRAPVSQMP